MRKKRIRRTLIYTDIDCSRRIQRSCIAHSGETYPRTKRGSPRAGSLRDGRGEYSPSDGRGARREAVAARRTDRAHDVGGRKLLVVGSRIDGQVQRQEMVPAMRTQFGPVERRTFL